MPTSTDFQSILNDLSASLRAGGITRTGPGSGSMMIISPVANELALLHERAAYLFDQSHLSTATGTYLDRLGGMLGVSRLQPTPAYSEALRFYVNGANFAAVGGAGTGVIPAQTWVYNAARPEIRFLTLQEAIFSPSTAEVVVSIQAPYAGSSYRAGAGQLTAHSHSALASLVFCTNLRPIDSGSDMENDDSFRFRISHRLTALSSPSVVGLRTRLLRVPGVRDVIIDPMGRGPGTLQIIVLSQLSPTSQDILSQVQAEANGIVAGGVAVEVSAPREIPVEVDMVVSPDDEATILAVRNAVLTRIAQLELGESLDVSDLIAAAYDADLDDASVTRIAIDGEDRELVNHQPPVDARYYASSLTVTGR